MVAGFFNVVLRLVVWLGLAAFVTLLSKLGVLGSSANRIVQLAIDYAYSYYSANKVALDFFAGALGIAFAALSSSFAIYRTWYYAEQQLPARLREFIEKLIHKHLADRTMLLAHANNPVVGSTRSRPLAKPLSFLSDLKEYGVRRSAKTADEFEQQAATLEDRIDVLRDREQELQRRAVTARLLRGLCLSRDASLKPLTSPQRRQFDEKALEAFEKAIKSCEHDLDAIEFAASQAIAVDRNARASELLADLISRPNVEPLQKCRARRLLAYVKERKGTRASLDEARPLLRTAIDELTNEDAIQPAKTEELANAWLQFGIVQTGRERYFSADRALEKARDLFARTGPDVRQDGLSAVSDAKERLKTARQDPGEVEDDQDL